MIPGISSPSRLGGLLSVIYSKAPFVGVLLRTQELFMVGFGFPSATTAFALKGTNTTVSAQFTISRSCPLEHWQWEAQNILEAQSGWRQQGPKSTGTGPGWVQRRVGWGNKPHLCPFLLWRAWSASAFIRQVDADVRATLSLAPRGP